MEGTTWCCCSFYGGRTLTLFTFWHLPNNKTFPNIMIHSRCIFCSREEVLTVSVVSTQKSDPWSIKPEPDRFKGAMCSDNFTWTKRFMCNANPDEGVRMPFTLGYVVDARW